ncbi:hypothetical protein EON65_54045 [archaeon]|nr:MAG: hypothetical protein EON65_54045 [archaeon]
MAGSIPAEVGVGTVSPGFNSAKLNFRASLKELMKKNAGALCLFCAICSCLCVEEKPFVILRASVLNLQIPRV